MRNLEEEGIFFWKGWKTTHLLDILKDGEYSRYGGAFLRAVCRGMETWKEMVYLTQQSGGASGVQWTVRK